MSKDIGASVRARLLALAKTENSNFDQVLVRYALERILYRIGQSQYADRYILKGALLFNLWYDMPFRATRDADLLGFGASDLESIRKIFAEIAGIAVDDGICFDPESTIVEEIRKDGGYTGARVLITSTTAKAICKTQIDIGFGDVVTPEPTQAIYPVMLKEFAPPCLKIYPVYTVIAEKLNAIYNLGMTNSRLKDYLDLWVLLNRETLDSGLLARAIAATFERRETNIGEDIPVGLTNKFANDASRRILWNRFLEKNQIPAKSLNSIIEFIRTTLEPIIKQVTALSKDR
jgi:predicted nucleotidyltransferase component of viral defense system